MNNVTAKAIYEKFIPLILTLFIMGVVAFYSCQKEISCEGCKDRNKPPIAISGPDQIISLPTDSVLLDGNSSSDPDGIITKWLWTKISGPASFNIVKPSDSTTKVMILVMGTYQFELRVTDNGGLSAKDTVQIIVKDTFQLNRPPIANAGNDTTITLPANAAVLDGSRSSDPDNNIASYFWTKIFGPSSFNMPNANAVQTQVTNLAEGIYRFELKVTDAGGLFSKDTMQVTVNQEASNSLVDIYVAGQLNALPVYWKNGHVVLLSNGAPNEWASSIAVAGSDVYVSGLEWWDRNVLPRYWKNNQEVQLSNVPGYIGITSIAISNGDVYVAGWEYTGSGVAIAKYWKNGQAVSLTNGTTDAEATSIAVFGNDVYVAGDINGIAKYWKNGQEVSLTDGSHQAYANSITVIGSDVYVAGSEENGTAHVAKYWKNGQAVSLTNGIRNASATSIAVSGSDVYVAGWEGDFYGMVGGTGSVAKYWKNGQEVSLTSGTTYAYANSIAIFGSDIYVAGTEIDGSNYMAKYWKNGQAVLLSSGGSATSIVVVQHSINNTILLYSMRICKQIYRMLFLSWMAICVYSHITRMKAILLTLSWFIE